MKNLNKVMSAQEFASSVSNRRPDQWREGKAAEIGLIIM
jgi:hypothetical protein